MFGALAVATMFFSYLNTKKDKYLLMQTLCNVFFAIQFYLVNALSAAVVCIITIFKSFIFYKYESKGKPIPLYILIIFELITIAFGIYIYTDFNSALPIIISCLYTYGTWQKNLKVTYSIGTFVSVVWVFYNFVVGAYVSIIGNAFEFVASIIGLYKLTKINDIKGIIFDFNGTLFWDSEIQETAWKTFGQKLTGRKITDEEFGTYFHGRTNQDTLEYLTGKKLTKEEVGDLASQKETIYRDLCKKNKEKFVLAPGVIKYLDYLKQNKIPITIATASEINNLNFFIKNLNLDKWFDKNKIIYDDGTFKGKPEPDIYLKAAAKLDLNPNQCVVFEDATSGVISAKRAGVKTIIGIVPKGRKNPFTKETVTEIIEDFESKKIYSIFKEL